MGCEGALVSTLGTKPLRGQRGRSQRRRRMEERMQLTRRGSGAAVSGCGVGPSPADSGVGSPRSPARPLLPARHTGRKNAYSAEPQLKLHTRLCGERTRGEC